MSEIILLVLLSIVGLFLFIWNLVKSALDFIGSAYRPSRKKSKLTWGEKEGSLTKEEEDFLSHLRLSDIETVEELFIYLDENKGDDQLDYKKIARCFFAEKEENE